MNRDKYPMNGDNPTSSKKKENENTNEKTNRKTNKNMNRNPPRAAAARET